MKVDWPRRLGPQVVELLTAEKLKQALEALLGATRHFAGVA